MNTTKHAGGRRLGPRAAALTVLLGLLQPLSPATGQKIPPKHITVSANMSFGRFAPGAGGAITVSAAGVRTRSGAVVLLMSTPAAARFSIGAGNSGNGNRAYILTLPASGAVSLASGPNRMPLTNFVSSAPGGGALPSGTQSVSVGATLNVAPNQPRGNYTGIFPVILEYE